MKESTWTTTQGLIYPAVFLPWHEIDNLLGHPFEGDPDDKAHLLDVICAEFPMFPCTQDVGAEIDEDGVYYTNYMAEVS